MTDSPIEELRRSWRTVLGCMAAVSIGAIGLFAYTNGVFVPVLVREAGFTHEQLGFATLLLSSIVAVLAPLAGAAMDRYGPLRMIAIGVVGEAAAFVAFATLPPVFGFYLGAITLLALLGVATTPPGFSRIVTARFDRARGFALGLGISGLGLMAMFGPVLMNHVIESVGWRSAYLVLAALVLVLGGGGLLLIASDGPHAAKRTAQTVGASLGGGWDALKRPLFWLLLVAFVLPSLSAGGYLFHLVNILRERGVSGDEAARVQGMVGLAVLIGRLTSGAAMDRFFAPYVAAVAFTISALGCVLLLSGDPIMIGAAALAIGLTIGAELDIMAFVMSRYFGVTNFGRLYGLAYGALIIGGGVSPTWITAVARTDGYPMALLISAFGTLAGAALLLFAPRFPNERRSPIGAEACAE
jgi:MFS family permease